MHPGRVFVGGDDGRVEDGIANRIEGRHDGSLRCLDYRLKIRDRERALRRPGGITKAGD